MTKMMTGSRRVVGTLLIGMLGVAAFGSPAGAAPGRASAKASSQGAIDGSAKAAAKQATVALADLGAGWEPYREASGFQKTTKKNCNTKFGSPLKVSDRGYGGPMFTDTAKKTFVYSYAYVFRTKAAAKAYTAARNAPKFFDCQEAQDDGAAKKADGKAYVRVVERTSPSIGGSEGLEAFYQEDAGSKTADGTEVPGADYSRYTFRHGRVVYVILIDSGLPSDAAASEELGTRLTAALVAASAGIDSRLTARGL